MPTPSFCALDEAYADWGFKKPNSKQQIEQTNSQQSHPSLKPIQKHQQTNNHFEEQEQDVYIPKDNGIKSFCPNCSNCINANNVLQQRIVETNTWPRPHWTPQNPHAYVPYDPFNRYWMNNVPQSHREDFGNGGHGMFEINNGANMSTEMLLQVILFILIALFIIQLIECLYARCTIE